jgi:hypothetical protein
MKQPGVHHVAIDVRFVSLVLVLVVIVVAVIWLWRR